MLLGRFVAPEIHDRSHIILFTVAGFIHGFSYLWTELGIHHSR